MISFSQFRKLAAERGLNAIDHGGGHWQLQGGTCLVNYYPEARKGPTIYVNGTRDSDEQGPPSRAIEVALLGPRLRGSSPPRSCGKFRRARLRLLRTNPICMWCGAALTKDTATLEHIIPRARGGSDRRDNFALACEGCNHGRGDAMDGPKRADDKMQTGGAAPSMAMAPRGTRPSPEGMTAGSPDGLVRGNRCGSLECAPALSTAAEGVAANGPADGGSRLAAP